MLAQPGGDLLAVAGTSQRRGARGAADWPAMRVVIAPDSFTGTLSAAQAAAAIAAGWSQRRPADDLVARPVSDGGPGFLAAISAAGTGRYGDAEVRGPLGEPTAAQILLTGQDPVTGWVESASAAGLHLIAPARRDPAAASSYGVGQLIGLAIRAGAGQVVVGVGGTGTTDAGAGLLAALGARAAGAPLDRGGLALSEVTEVDLEPARAAVAGVALQVATDVEVPLLGPRGAAQGFAPQKGATQDQVLALESALTRFVGAVGPDPAGRHPEVALGAGAGGGIGYALMALGARRVAGIDTVCQAVGLSELIGSADLVITGEGALDWQSATGKVVAGVGHIALGAGVPMIVLAGRVELARSQWPALGVAAAYGVVEPGQPPGPAQHAAAQLAALAQRIAGTWGGAG